MTSDQIKHLEFIQAVINRLAGNSFTVKSWTIALVSGMLAFAAKDSNPNFAILAFFPALCLWGLDAYYLRQERIFRKLYDAARSNPSLDCSMDVTTQNAEVDGCFGTAFTPALLAVHVPTMIAIVAVLVHALVRR